jgi:hypothetical protein
LYFDSEIVKRGIVNSKFKEIPFFNLSAGFLVEGQYSALPIAALVPIALCQSPTFVSVNICSSVSFFVIFE